MTVLVVAAAVALIFVADVVKKINENNDVIVEEETCEDTGEYSSKDGLDDSKSGMYSSKDAKGFEVYSDVPPNPLDGRMIIEFPPLPPPPPICCPPCVTEVNPPSHHEKRRN